MKTHKQKAHELEQARRAYEATPEAQAVQHERAMAYHAQQVQVAVTALAEAEWRLAEAKKTGFSIITCQEAVDFYQRFKLERETAPLLKGWLGRYPPHLDQHPDDVHPDDRR